MFPILASYRLGTIPESHVTSFVTWFYDLNRIVRNRYLSNSSGSRPIDVTTPRPAIWVAGMRAAGPYNAVHACSETDEHHGANPERPCFRSYRNSRSQGSRHSHRRRSQVSGGRLTMPTKPEPVRILHLSDFHFSSDTEWEAIPLLKNLTQAVADLVCEGRIAPPSVTLRAHSKAHSPSPKD